MNDSPSAGAAPARCPEQAPCAPAVRRIAVDRDPDCDFSKFDWGRHGWRAQWIGAASGPGAAPGVWAFRRRFRLEDPATLRLHVTADQRYDLWIDGVWAGFGSERGLHASWFYESFEVRLEPGEHAVVARVWWTGRGTSLQHAGHATSDRPGFLLHAEKPFDELLDTAPDSWEALPLAGYSFLDPYAQVQGAYVAVGARTRLDGRAHAWGFEAGGGAGWAPAVASGLPLSFRAGPNQVDEWHALTPGTLPAMRQSFHAAGAVRFAAAVPARKAGEPGGELADFGNEPVREAESDPALAAAWRRVLAAGAGGAGADAPAVVPARSAQRVIVDLGDYFCAFPRVVVRGGRGADVSVRWAEALLKGTKGTEKGPRDDIDGKFFQGLADAFVAPGGAEPRLFEPLWFEAGRFVEIVVRAADEPLEVLSFSLRETGYPIDWACRFETDDARWGGAFRIMERTLRMCSHESYFDCPYYEQLMYGGDSRLEMLATYATTRDDRLPRKAMTVLDRTRSEAGLTLSRQSPDEPQVIPPYALHYVQMVADYMLWRGDRAFVRKRLGGVRAVLNAWAERIGEDGLARNPRGWNFVDWNYSWWGGMPPNGDVGCASPVNNLHFAWALRMAAAVEDWAGDPEFSAWDRRLAERVGNAVVEAYWDDSRDLFAETPARDRFIEHTQCMAVLGGFVPAGREAALGEALATAPDLDRTTVYYRSYLIDAFRALHRPADMYRCFDLWFTLEPLGLRTVLEQPEPTRSDCHAWGSHPMYHALASVAGIRPAAPGFAQVRIEPQPGPLKRLRCSVPHPKGDVSLDLALDAGGRWRGSVSTPPDVPFELVLPGETLRRPGGPFDI
ncbi:MAG: alpha-L-rhamnosidase [Kiritimatiellae bacterium]|nr:alpha-L-rhamnosidase [Kiritimatiellia bacterium]